MDENGCSTVMLSLAFLVSCSTLALVFQYIPLPFFFQIFHVEDFASRRSQKRSSQTASSHPDQCGSDPGSYQEEPEAGPADGEASSVDLERQHVGEVEKGSKTACHMFSETAII